MKRTIVILIILSIIGTIGVYAYTQLGVKTDVVLKQKIIYKTSSPITASFVLGDDIALGTASGKLFIITKDGTVKWSKDIGTNISQIKSNKNGNLLVCSVYFYLFSPQGKKLFYKGYKNYIGLSGKFLSDGNIELIYQSLTDLSYIAVKTDMNGKTIASRKIPDLGETSFIKITDKGNILFVGARGELYLLDNTGIVNNVVLNNKNADYHEIYARILPNGNIVCGYKVNFSENQKVPVYLYSDTLQSIKQFYINGPINNVIVGLHYLVFATKDNFLLYDFKGNLINKKIKLGFTPMEYSENESEQVFVFSKNIGSEQGKPIYSVVTIKNNKEAGRYLFSSSSIPQIILDSKDEYIFVINQDTVSILYN